MTPVRLRMLRARYRVRQDDLATALGVHQSRISRAESGEARLTDAEIAALEAFFTALKAARNGRPSRQEVNAHG